MEYHVHDNVDVSHKYVKMFWEKKQFPSFPFCGQHNKPHGARGLSKHYHIRFGPKLGQVICAIGQIPCACVKYLSMLDKSCITGFTLQKKRRYVTDCKCWLVLGSFNNWNIIALWHKATTGKSFNYNNQFFLMKSMSIWTHWFNLVNMAQQTRRILQEWYTMWLSFSHRPTICR